MFLDYLLKFFAKIVNSRLFLHNPYVDFEVLQARIAEVYQNRMYQRVIAGRYSKFYEQAIVFNFQDKPESIIIWRKCI